MNIFAGIVTYNPDIKRLSQCISSIDDQVNEVVLYDNHSSNIDDISNAVASFSNIRIIRGDTNMGIAVALNALANFGVSHSYDAVLFLDQDSIACSNLVGQEEMHLNGKTAVVGPLILEDNPPDRCELPHDIIHVKHLINSGSLLSLSAWKNSPGYDERLFLDLVDFEFNMQLRRCGYNLIQNRNVYILHQLGESMPMARLSGPRSAPSLSIHPPMRQYDMARSYSIIWHGPQSDRHDLGFGGYFFRYIVTSLLLRPKRITFVKCTLRGWRDGKLVATQTSRAKR